MYPTTFYYPPVPNPPQIPQPDLLTLIGLNDTQKVREHLDAAFWGGKPVKPDWSHLFRALTVQDLNPSMVRLLVTWGTPAVPDDEQLRTLYANVGEKYPQCMKLLRRCGMRLPSSVMEKPPGFEKMPKTEIPENLSLMEEPPIKVSGDRVNGNIYVDGRITLLPEEWRKALKAVQDMGAAEAVIAGGALRDFYAKRNVKDVDIFLATRGREGNNKKFLKKAFDAAGLKISAQNITLYNFEKFPRPASVDIIPASQNYWSGKQALPTSALESWTIVAGPERTEYNIIFVSGPLGERLSRKNTLALLDAFDIDLCQIATDDINLITTPAYREGVRRKRITMKNEKMTSKDHLQRLVKKYPDFELCAASKRLLTEQEQPKRAHTPPRPEPPPNRLVK